MKEELVKEFLKYNQLHLPLSRSFLKRFAFLLLKEYDARNYVKSFKMLSARRFVGEYDYYGTKNISVYPGVLLKCIEPRTITNYNVSLLQAVAHECFHAIQYKTINEGEDSIKKQIFTLSDNVYSGDYAISKSLKEQKLYWCSPMEVNAEIMAYLYVNDFVNMGLNDECKSINNEVTMTDISNAFDPDGLYSSPTMLWYNLNDMEKEFSMLQYEELKNFDRMLIGLPLSHDYLSEVEKIKNGKVKVLNLQEHLKNIQ